MLKHLNPSSRLPGPSECAIGRSVDEERPTCRTNDEVRFRLHCTPAPPFQLVRRCRFGHSPPPSLADSLSATSKRLHDFGTVRPGVIGYLDLLERNFKGERLVVVRVQRALLDAGLLLLQPLSVLHQGYLHVGICERFPLRISDGSELGVYSPESPPTSIFFRFFASRMTTVSLPAVGTYRSEKHMSPSLFSCNDRRWGELFSGQQLNHNSLLLAMHLVGVVTDSPRFFFGCKSSRARYNS